MATRTRIGLDDDERRSIALGSGFRIVGTPLIGIFGVINSALVIHETGSAVFGIVSAISAIALLFPFSDLGIGATVTTASAQYARGTIAVV
ncbi:hypothetical protein G3W01_24050, partial [Escherichia coli]|nr:hypothetical protein [Escherichia coli]